MPAFAPVSLADALVAAQVTPALVDIDPISFCISAEAVYRFVTTDCAMHAGSLRNKRTGGRVRALCTMHRFGQMAEMDALMMVARQVNMLLVEDASEAIGARDSHRHMAGSHGDVAFWVDTALGNATIDQASPPLDAECESRVLAARHYAEAFALHDLARWCTLPALSSPRAQHVFSSYVIRVARRAELLAFLEARDLRVEMRDPIPLHLLPEFQRLNRQAGDFPQAERAAAESLALPIAPGIERAYAQRVVAMIADFYAT